MRKISKKFKTVDEYIKSYPPVMRERLEVIRREVKKLAPEATELISYNIPSFKLNGVLLYFAGHTHHIGLYPYTKAIKLTKKELRKYKIGKGSIQFQLDEKLPLPLIRKIIKSRVAEKRAPKKKVK